LAESYADIGRWHASDLRAGNRRVASCRDAESWYRKSLATFQKVQGTSALTGGDAELPAFVARELAGVRSDCGK
jgi:hypothetical protein